MCEDFAAQVSVRVIAAPAPIARAVLEPVGPRDWEVQHVTRHTLHITRHISRFTRHTSHMLQVISAGAAFLESALVAQAGTSCMSCDV